MNRGINKNRKNSFLLHFKKELGGFFLFFIFLFPQANNALHYFVVEHHFHQYNKHEKQFHHNHKTHDCEQSIFKIPSLLLFDFEYKEITKIIRFYWIENPFYQIFYKKIFFENITNKGPPEFCQDEFISASKKLLNGFRNEFGMTHKIQIIQIKNNEKP